MKIKELFLQSTLPPGFSWINQPAQYRLGAGLEIYTNKETDFWQSTHYGFQRDDGHCLLTRCRDDFCMTTQVEYKPDTMYDQCGLMVRLDSQNWIKVSTEYENEQVSRLGSVVTNLGYSDWATQDIPSNQREMWYRISKRGRDFLLESAFDGLAWQQLRIAHLHQAAEAYDIGVYACSPVGRDYWCRFFFLEISDNDWLAPVTNG